MHITNNANVYVRINDDRNKLLEEWDYNEEGSCYDYEDEFFKDGTYEIIENSKDRLVIQYSNEGYSETLTLNVEGENLKVVVNYSDENGYGEDIYYFDKSSININNLEMCEL